MGFGTMTAGENTGIHLEEGPTATTRNTCRCRRLSLAQLVELVVSTRDRCALGEFHDRRPVFRYAGRNHMLFAEYVDRLRRAAISQGNVDVADEAYDLTIDKFNNLPDRQEDSANQLAPAGSERRSGPDCCNYFRPFLRELRARLGDNPVSTATCEERLAARLLQGLVARHYRLSLAECRRRGSVSRFVWQLPGGRLSVLMPRHISGQQRSQWLTANIPDPDPSRPGERARVQATIDQKSNEAWAPMTEDGGLDLTGASPPWAVSAWTADVPSVSAEGLADAVADEKAETIQLQRPAIKALGGERLRQMIHRIFADLGYGEYRGGRVAREYGLAKATYSRFAGGCWQGNQEGPGARMTVPDLWRNLAQVVAGNVDFVRAAQETGVWRRVKEIVRNA